MGPFCQHYNSVMIRRALHDTPRNTTWSGRFFKDIIKSRLLFTRFSVGSSPIGVYVTGNGGKAPRPLAIGRSKDRTIHTHDIKIIAIVTLVIIYAISPIRYYSIYSNIVGGVNVLCSSSRLEFGRLYKMFVK